MNLLDRSLDTAQSLLTEVLCQLPSSRLDVISPLVEKAETAYLHLFVAAQAAEDDAHRQRIMASFEKAKENYKKLLEVQALLEGLECSTDKVLGSVSVARK